METSKCAGYSLMPRVRREEIHLFTNQSNTELEQLIIVEYENQIRHFLVKNSNFILGIH